MNDADLEAELLALSGNSSGKSSKKSGGGDSGMLSMGDLDKMMADVDGMGEDEELSDVDEDDGDLLGELQVRGVFGGGRGE